MCASGATLRQQEYEDGWIYEASAPEGCAHGLTTIESGRVLFSGHWLAAFTVEGRQYITVWVERACHERLYPNGPLAARYLSADDMAAERAATDRWIFSKRLRTVPETEGPEIPAGPHFRTAI